MQNKKNNASSESVVPFLKWAGGKRWLVERFASILPLDFDTYIEPFLGGGSVFFFVQPDIAILSDSNYRLIETYQTIKHHWDKVQDILEFHQEKHNKRYYYRIRDSQMDSEIQRAAQFIYLNRTCWNGLYRVNLSGKFNVPIGTKESVVLRSDNFKEISEILQRAELLCQDFEVTIGKCKENDFLYIDPPYTVNHNYNGFLKYNERIFSWKDQIRLRDCVAAAVKKGAKVVISNADHQSIRDLYAGIGEIKTISRKSVIAGSAKKRAPVNELLVLNIR